LLTRIMLLSPILMGISNLISAVLRVFQKFLITALAPVFYNLGSIVGIVFFVPLFGISGLAWGIVLGAGLHLLIQLPALFKVGFRFSRLFSFKDKELLLTIKLALPRAVGLAASQINLIIITIIGSGLAAGSIGIFNLANDLSLPIIGLIAIPFSTAVFPSMSLDYSRGDKKELLRKFSSAFRQILFLIIPASAIAFLLRAQLVRIVFGAGRFNWSDTKLTAACFGLLMFGLFAGGLIYLLAKTFYSMHNTIIPALVSILSVASTVLFGYLFVWLFSFSNIVSNAVSLLLDVQGMHNLEVVGLAIALSLNSIIQLLLLIFFFRKDFPFKEIMHSFVRIIIASGAAVVFTYLVRQGLGGFTGTNRFWFLVLQAGTSGILGFCFYFLIAAAMKSPEASYIFKKVFHVRY
ncbi:oligosaccharide flippase family protein, partial [Patescibacteria group bacterium]|nr:oligosaccharide flippase family protein [Patescibacteria group bacterium]